LAALLPLLVTIGQDEHLCFASGALLQMQALYVEIGRSVQLPTCDSRIPYRTSGELLSVDF
jgi:hypothetical protein